jgi:hypothetical protein
MLSQIVARWPERNASIRIPAEPGVYPTGHGPTPVPQRSRHQEIAFRKGCTAERTATIKHRHYVRVTGPDGVDMQGTRGVGLGLLEAKRRLDAMPDHPTRKKRRRLAGEP